MLDSGCCVPPDDGAVLICDIEEVEEIDTPIGPPAGLNVEEEGSRPVGRSGSVSVMTSSSSSSSSSSILGQADWSSTRFRRSFRALSASCLEGKWGGGWKSSYHNKPGREFTVGDCLYQFYDMGRFIKNPDER